MVLSNAQIVEWLGGFMWPLFRIGALLMSMPVFSARFVPVRVRGALAVAITLLIAPILPEMPQVDLLGPEGVLIIIQQILIGVAMGLVFQVIFAAISFGGQGIALSMGLGFASMVDPQNGIQVPVISQFYIILVTLLFLLLNVHLLLFELIVDSFHILPVAAEGLSKSTLWDMLGWTGQAFAAGIMIALPAIGALLLVNVAFGIVTRAAPQLNIFAVGFPAVMMIGFIILHVSLKNLPDLFEHMVESGFQLIRTVVLGG